MPNTYVALRTETVAVATNTVTFSLSGISGYTDLVLQYSPLASSNTTTHLLRLNGDTASNYSQTGLRGDGSSATSFRSSNQTSLTMYPQDYDNTTIPSVITVNLQNYNNATTFKTILWRAGMSAGGQGVSAVVGLWRKTPEAITSITLTSTNNFAVGSTFSLYGIANADQGAAKATGGIITEDSTYWYHTFAASGAFIPKQSLTADVLVIAGGGGGGYWTGGGGGAGGLQLFSSQSLTATNYTCTIGSGGVGAQALAGTQGVNSSFGALTASVGGGGGGGYNGGNLPATTGGSGGGGDSAAAPSGGAAGTSGQGNNGGNAFAAPSFGGGGGGGSAAVGAAATSAGAGNGGAGTNTYSSWAIATGTGASGFYAGGGGGGVNTTSYTAGTGGSGGGGNGSNTNVVAATSAQINTGSGGGGAGASGAYNGSSVAPGNGGSGVVIVRYLKA